MTLSDIMDQPQGFTADGLRMSDEEFAERLKDVASQQSLVEGRSLSVVTRTVHYGTDSCLLCRSNTDPKAVPLHPNCTCDIRTDDVQTGQMPTDHPIFGVLSTADETVVRMGESELPAAITMDPVTAGVIAMEDLRFGDLARWLEQMEPYLSATDTYLTIIQEFNENLEDAADIIDEIAEGTEDITEAINARRVWFGLSKAVVGL